MKPSHFQNLFSKPPLFEFIAKASSDSLLWFCVDDLDSLTLSEIYKKASELSCQGQQSLLKEHHLLISKKQYALGEVVIFKGFVRHFLDNASYKQIKYLNIEDKSHLTTIIPDTYHHILS